MILLKNCVCVNERKREKEIKKKIEGNKKNNHEIMVHLTTSQVSEKRTCNILQRSLLLFERYRKRKQQIRLCYLILFHFLH